ncbi:LuxR family transcriptional regulator [Geodermatophilus sp. SYSU D00691]
MLADDVLDLHRLADELLDRAAAHSAGRAARSLPHPVEGLRQTVIALRRGAALDEHESPGAASVLVLRGRVRLVAGDDVAELTELQAAPIPDRRHGLRADEDSVVLLSVAVPARA